MKTFRLAGALAASIVLLGALLFACSDPARDEAVESVLQRGLTSDPESLDPHEMRSVQAANLLRDIGEGLLSYSATGELVAGAAAEWTISEDGLTYTFHLREDARWSNGQPVTAGHFAFSLRRLVDPATAAFYAQMLGDIVNAQDIIAGDSPPADLGVEAVDDRTLVITLVRPTPYLLSLLTYPSTFPVHPDAVAEHGDAFTRAGNLLSNGAYKLDAWEPGSVLELSRNEHYWNNAATAIDEVRYHVLTQEMTQLNRFRAGELHITGSVPPDNFAQIREEHPEELHIAPYLGVYYYGFNLTKPPFKGNPELREALSMAVDRDVLVNRITGRGEEPAYSWVPPGVDNYEPRRFIYAEQSQDERNAHARLLLREAGYGPEKPLQIELRYNTSDTEKKIALAVQSMWRDVLGVETTLVNEEFQVLLANMRDREVTQVFRSSWIGDYNDAHTFLSIMEGGNPSNMPGYKNDQYDALMQQAAEQVDPKSRRYHLEEAERVLLADHPVIPLYFYVSKHLVSPDIIGWGDNVLDYHYSQHLSLAPTAATP
ncbi:MAG: peptide ABC transporter substrate-binding protein [Gammaproteobacteria bacterium]|nr:peptide ABC transporter substrate-binding protein [Gammaproteobacteria bacterium]MDH3749251.1 peptide ABC transporter substrate-binding protein [Gammaproteobacteria bacterium]MDH3806153.1 peptide ABC transporter substrate-binding protein [Gammaproteobacteria bacterium]